jgi:hypothetical protein
MSTLHKVQQGEHLTQLAAKYGFRDYRTIWNHAENDELRKARPNPHVLYPDDLVFIPDKEEKEESRPTTRIHRFQVEGQPLKLRLVLTDFDNLPIQNKICSLEVEGVVYAVTTDADGLVEQEIPNTASNGKLTVPDLDLELPIRIGDLDPPEEDSGWQARLINLGYYAGAIGIDDADIRERLHYSIEEFQCDHGLKVTGEFDGSTRDKLKEVHGC